MNALKTDTIGKLGRKDNKMSLLVSGFDRGKRFPFSSFFLRFLSWPITMMTIFCDAILFHGFYELAGNFSSISCGK